MGARIGCSPKDAVQYLKSGEPVALPTETVYGLAAPLFNEEAIAKRFREYNDKTVHVANHYKKKGVHIDVEGNCPVEEVFNAITKAIEEMK